MRTAWGDPLIRRLCLFAFIPFGTFIALTTWTQALLEPAGVSVDQVGVILISCVLAGVVGTVIIPVVAVRRRKEVVAGVIATVVTAAVCALLAIVPGFGTGLACLSVAGLLLLPMLAIILELVERHTGGADGVSSGLVWTLGNLGGLVVTGIVGFTLDSPTVSFLILGAVTLLALPCSRGSAHPSPPWPPRRRRRQDPSTRGSTPRYDRPARGVAASRRAWLPRRWGAPAAEPTRR